MSSRQPQTSRGLRSVWDALDGYARFYAPASLLVFCLSFADLFDDRIDDNRTTHFGSLWEIAGTPGGGPAILGIMLMASLVALLARSGLRTSRSSGWPSMIAVLSGISLIMLYVRPGTGSPRPELADGGAMLTALCWVLLVVALVQVMHLGQIRRQLRSRTSHR